MSGTHTGEYGPVPHMRGKGASPRRDQLARRIHGNSATGVEAFGRHRDGRGRCAPRDRCARGTRLGTHSELVGGLLHVSVDLKAYSPRVANEVTITVDGKDLLPTEEFGREFHKVLDIPKHSKEVDVRLIVKAGDDDKFSRDETKTSPVCEGDETPTPPASSPPPATPSVGPRALGLHQRSPRGRARDPEHPGRPRRDRIVQQHPRHRRRRRSGPRRRGRSGVRDAQARRRSRLTRSLPVLPACGRPTPAAAGGESPFRARFRSPGPAGADDPHRPNEAVRALCVTAPWSDRAA